MAIDKEPESCSGPYTVLIQASAKPIFRGTIATDSSFRCLSCGNILIENYIERNFVSVRIKCFRCGKLTSTPPLEPGEVLSLRVLTLGSEGDLSIDSTVDAPPGLTITSDQALIATAKLTSPQPQGLRLDLSEEGIAFLIQRYDEITGNKFAIQSKIISKTGDSKALRLPFVWSIRHIQSSISYGIINIDDPKTKFGLSCLRLFCDVVGKWQHHPRFITIAKDLGKPESFLHTSAQFIVASYLYQHGNRIGFSLENLHGEANPDLYVTGVQGYDKIYLEIKAPRVLNVFDQPKLGALVLEKPVKNCIEGSIKQINRVRPGALVIFSSLQDHRAPAELERCTTNWLNRYGRNRKSLAAVVVMSMNDNRIVRSDTKIHQPLAVQMIPVLNPYFEGEVAIRTE